MLQKIGIGLGCLLLALSATVRADESAAASKPNIIFILADDLGYGDVGCFGQETILTPHLDQMAAEGVRFTQAYAGSTVCAPSRSAIITGQHTGHTRVRGNLRIPLEPEDPSVAQALKDVGYATGLVGKWGLGEPDTTGIPNRKGFDYFFGYLNQQHAHDFYPEYLWRNEERVPLEGNKNVAPFAHGDKGTYAPALLRDEALDFVERHKDGPFFLYWAMIRPHAANESGRYYGNETGEGMPVLSDAPYSDRDWAQPQKNHAAMITDIDAYVGKMLAKLKELGIAENTLVVFSSDNGTHKEGGAIPEFFKSSGPLRGIKRDLYDGGIRVPTIAWWPGRVEHRVDDTVWAFWDLFPTFADLAGASKPAELDGISLAPILGGTGSLPENRPPLYWEFHEGGFKQAVRVGDWKLVRPTTRQAPELYDLSRDIGEMNDLAEEMPEKVAELERLFTEMRTESPHWPTP